MSEATLKAAEDICHAHRIHGFDDQEIHRIQEQIDAAADEEYRELLKAAKSVKAIWDEHDDAREGRVDFVACLGGPMAKLAAAIAKTEEGE